MGNCGIRAAARGGRPGGRQARGWGRPLSVQNAGNAPNRAAGDVGARCYVLQHRNAEKVKTGRGQKDGMSMPGIDPTTLRMLALNTKSSAGPKSLEPVSKDIMSYLVLAMPSPLQQ